MAPWLRVLEAYMVQALLRTPAFHRGVEKVAKYVHRVRHGIPPEELGGTKIDQPGTASFLRHFTEEVQTQLGRAEAKAGETSLKSESAVPRRGARAKSEWENSHAEEEGADAAWKTAQRSADEPPKQGFMGEYIGALREQLRSGR